jgi:homoserine O-acetyltransferase/O-succinyltransferase
MKKKREHLSRSLLIMSAQTFTYNQPFILESGNTLPNLQIAYHTYGNYEKGKSKVVWVCHALTANSDAADWWKGLIGENYFFNTEEYFIVCANVLGSCYGTTGPLSINPETDKPYYNNFPLITVRDMVQAHMLLRKHLGIEKIYVAIGGSLGGQQLLEWAVTEPELIENIIPIATNAFHSPWGIAFNETQRMAILSDNTWGDESEHAANDGLKAARAIAMLSYRHYDTYRKSQTETEFKTDNFKAASYQQHQGNKLAKRFNAYSYYTLSKAMDSHNLARGRSENVESVLKTIKSRACCIGLKTDILYPVLEQKFLAEHIPNAEYYEIETLYGHDGFLLEFEQLNHILHNFLKQ